MPASGGVPRQLTGKSPAEDDYYPQWFPDGRQLAVLRDVPGTESDVWVVGLDATARRLTAHPAFDGKSTISPDGRRIAFPSERSGARNLWIMPVAEGESAAQQFTFDGGRGPAWSPDGRWIAYGCPVDPRGFALCLKQVEGGPVIQVTDGSHNDFNPEWGPDGAWIAVAQGDDDAFGRIAVVDVGAITSAVTRTARSGEILFDSERDGNRDIYVMYANGSNVRRLTQTAGKGRMSWGPKWSPDRTRIAFFSNRDGVSEEGRPEEYEIYVMAADGTELRRLTQNQAVDREPSWSADGKEITFVSNRDGNYEIYVMSERGSDVRRLTNHHADDAAPRWSPEGTHISFVSRRDGPEFRIYVMNADGSGVRRLTDFPAGGHHWSPDGAKLVFDSRLLDGNWEVYVMDADGANVSRLTNHPKADARPKWSRDGTKIIFHSTRDGTSETELEDGSEYEIYIMDADGSNVRRLTFNRVFDGHPDW